uniref:Uncharacterized protein n=1 Tax=Globodera rostochiensis TaxID=31243 RepID=A0A914IDV6_GLORO
MSLVLLCYAFLLTPVLLIICVCAPIPQSWFNVLFRACDRNWQRNDGRGCCDWQRRTTNRPRSHWRRKELHKAIFVGDDFDAMDWDEVPGEMDKFVRWLDAEMNAGVMSAGELAARASHRFAQVFGLSSEHQGWSEFRFPTFLGSEFRFPKL